MIDLVTTSIFESHNECLVNPVNCVGIMGKGLALEFKHRFPEMFNDYNLLCSNGDLVVGSPYMWTGIEDPLETICLFPTKNHWKYRSSVQIIESGLQNFNKLCEFNNILSVSFPMIGCGLGGLNFEHQVLPLMVKYLHNSDIKYDVHVHN
jgi:O-acetyl-ADP-ribose deacetylase (regulator of RNase III)